MKKHGLFFLAGLFIFSASASAETIELRVENYNVKGIPWPPGNDMGRLKDIGKIFRERRINGTAPHVVLLSEAMVKKSKNINKKAGYPYTAKGSKACDKMYPKKVRAYGKRRGKPRKWRIATRTCALFNAGLRVLSEYPILSVKKLAFGRCKGPDCLSNKGFMAVEIEVPGVPEPISILSTHMQSTSGVSYNAAAKVTYKQIDIITEMLPKFVLPTRALVFAGDFNFKPKKKIEQYETFIAKTGLTNVGKECVDGLSECEYDKRSNPEHFWYKSNDQHFYRNGELIQLTPVYAELNFKEDIDGVELSDHYGYEVHYRIDW